MAISASKEKFGDFVRAHALDGQVISREDEMDILKEAVAQFDLGLNEARGILAGVAEEHDIALVSTAERHVETLLEQMVRWRRISRRAFKAAVAVYAKLVAERVPVDEIRRRVKQMAIDRGWKPKRSRWLIGSRRWFRAIE